MSDPARTRASMQTISEHTSRYETLRNHALERNIAVGRFGLAVLLRQGVAAWLEAWSKGPTPPPQPVQRESMWPCSLPVGSNAEVVNVLTAMTLGHLQEVRA